MFKRSVIGAEFNNTSADNVGSGSDKTTAHVWVSKCVLVLRRSRSRAASVRENAAQHLSWLDGGEGHWSPKGRHGINKVAESSRTAADY